MISITNKDLDACMELVMHLTHEQVDLIKELATLEEIWVLNMGYLEGTLRNLKQNIKDQLFETPCHIGNGRK